jgi:pseudaminic acid cytidylyltransferase
MTLAIIPARGGSKRIPRKNIRLFRGKPIISYVIRSALESASFDEVMVSTDDDEIAAIAREHGASVPFLRSAAAADDTTTITSVIREVLLQYSTQGREFSQACCLVATAALVSPERLRQAEAMLDAHPETDGIISLVRSPQPAVRSLLVKDGRVQFMLEDQVTSRSQDQAETYFDAAQMYWVRTAPFLAREERTMSFLKRLPLVLSEFETQDINTPADWQLAEWKHEFLELHRGIAGTAQV